MPPNTTPTVERRKISLQNVRANSADIEDGDANFAPRQPNSNLRMAATVLLYVQKRRSGYKIPRNPYGETMYKLSEEMRAKHSSFFKGLRGRLQLSSGEVVNTFVDVASQIFSGGFNFGRLVSLYSWSLYVIEFCTEENQEEDITTIVQKTVDSLEQHGSEFRKLGGWDGFKDYFSEPGEKLWQGLMLTTFSFGALAAFLYAKS